MMPFMVRQSSYLSSSSCSFPYCFFLLRLQFPFPNMTTSRAENTDTFLVNEADRSNIEKYLSTIATSILNIDSKSQVSKEIIKFLDGNSNIIFDKIRMVQLESRLINTISYCERLEQRLLSTERNLNESTNIVSFLRYKVDQLENVNGVGTRCVETVSSFPFVLYFLQCLTYLWFTTLSRPSHSSQNSNGPSHDQRYQQQSQSNPISSYGVLNGNSSSSGMDSVNMNSLRLNDISATYASENSINPSQLITLAESVLNEKGPLPVGEVGKTLQEATGNPQLSQILKERHNGLKKFLEKFPDKFIMSCDHPFNPHVYLRRSYSPDEQREIETGSTAYLDKKVKVCITTSYTHVCVRFIALISQVSMFFIYVRNLGVERIESNHGQLLAFRHLLSKTESTLRLCSNFQVNFPHLLFPSISICLFTYLLSQIQYFQYFKCSYSLLKIRWPFISTYLIAFNKRCWILQFDIMYNAK